MSDRIGVLFVHGIGEQEPGSTLMEWGEALASWLDDWGRGAGVWHRHNGLEAADLDRMLQAVAAAGGPPAVQSAAHAFADPLLDIHRLQSTLDRSDPRARAHDIVGGTCVLSSVTLSPPLAPAYVPPHGELTIRTFDRNGSVGEYRVALAEAHWANVFPVARYAEFLRWATVHLPLILQAHLGWGLYQARAGEAKRWRQRLERAVEVTGWYLLSLLLPVFPVIALALLVVSVPLLIAPFPAARGFARRLQGIVVNVLGDIYVLLERPARAAAIRERVRASFTWLASQCDSVIVVAHSQGAAVALDYLVEEQPAKARHLITLGSGARKLAHLRFSRQGSEAYGTPQSAWMAVAAPALAALAIFDMVRGYTPGWLSLALLLGIVVAFVVSRWRHGSADHLQESHQWRQLLRSMTLPWTDLSAGSDVVSNGAHVVPKKNNTRPHLLTSNGVQNRGSFISDHTTYWENQTQVVERVASVVAKAVGFKLKALTPYDQETLAHAWFARMFRVSYLRLGRTVQWLALLHLLLRGTEYIERTGRTALDGFGRIPADWVPNWVASIASGVLGLNFGMGPEWLVGAVTFMVLTGAALNLWLSAWRIIDRFASRRMFRRHVDPLHGRTTVPPDLVLFAYGAFLVGVTWQTFFRYVPPPPLVSLETGLAALLLVLNLRDLARCIRFIGTTVRSLARRRPTPPPRP